MLAYLGGMEMEIWGGLMGIYSVYKNLIGFQKPHKLMGNERIVNNLFWNKSIGSSLHIIYRKKKKSGILKC